MSLISNLRIKKRFNLIYSLMSSSSSSSSSSVKLNASAVDVGTLDVCFIDIITSESMSMK